MGLVHVLRSCVIPSCIESVRLWTSLSQSAERRPSGLIRIQTGLGRSLQLCERPPVLLIKRGLRAELGFARVGS